MTNSYTKRTCCRLCDSTDLHSVLKLVDTPIGDHYLSTPDSDQTQETFPCELFVCGACGLAQLLVIVDQDAVYREYIYKTSDSLGLVEHFKTTVDSVLKTVNGKGLVIDIGSNDGSLLSIYQSHGCDVQGVDPAVGIANAATDKGIPTIPDFFSKKVATDIVNTRGKANIVTSNNTMANIDDMHSFVNAVSDVLDDKGVFVFETGYFLDLFTKFIVDNIYHEHLSYFSIKPLQSFFAGKGMELFHVERINPKGGSIRCYVQKKGGPYTVQPIVEELLALEAEQQIHDVSHVSNLQTRMTSLKEKIHTVLGDLKQQGKKIAGFGASVGVTTLLYNLELKDLLEFTVDNNTDRQGLYSPGIKMPVKSPDAVCQESIDYIFILAWMYNEPIIKRNQSCLRNGAKFITMLPEVEVVQ